MSCTDFPSTGLIPNVTTHTVGNITYIWTGIAWESQVNVPAGELVNDSSQAYIFDTVADYQASTIVFPVGKTIHLNDRQADFTVISGTGTANGFDIIASNSTGQSVDLKWLGADKVYTRSFGVVADKSDKSAAMQACVDWLYFNNPYGGTVHLPTGQLYTATPINPYNYNVFDIYGDTSLIASPKYVKPTIKFLGSNTIWSASENSSCLKPQSNTLPAFYDLFVHNVRFVGVNNTGTSVDIKRDLASPVRLKFYNCDFSEFDSGLSYLPFVEGGVNPRNGFIGAYGCYFTYNNTGIKTNGCDNIFLDDCNFESNNDFGQDIASVVSFKMTGGKLQYNGKTDDNTTAQVVLRSTCRNVTYDTVYLEGGADTTEANNAGKGLSSFIINGNVTSLEYINGYMNGLLAECPFRIASGGVQRLKVRTDILKYQFNSSNEVIQGSSSFSYSQHDFSEVVYGTNYDSGGSVLIGAPDFSIAKFIGSNGGFIEFDPQMMNGVLSTKAYGVGSTTLFSKIIFNIENGSTESDSIFLGSNIVIANTDLSTSSGTAGKLNIGFEADNIQVKNNLGFNVSISFNINSFL
jgi:hypothetical protein